MRRPDIRQRVIEAVLDLAADAGVDDVHLIAALGPAPAHDRGRAAPRRRRPGLRRLRARAACSTTTTPRTPTTWPSSAPPTRARRSRSTSGPPRATCSSTSTSTSSPWTAAGSRTATGLACYRSLRHHHNVAHDAAQPSLHGPAHSPSCTRSNWRMGKVHPRRRREDLPDRDDAQHRHVPDAVRLPAEARVGVDAARPGHVHRPCRPASSARRPGCAAQDLPVDARRRTR